MHPRPDIAVHFNPRFHTTKPHVICNTLHSGRWEAEARWPRVPLQRGAPFRLLFLFGNEDMKVTGRDGLWRLEPSSFSSSFLPPNSPRHCEEEHPQEGLRPERTEQPPSLAPSCPGPTWPGTHGGKKALSCLALALGRAPEP